MNIITKIIDQSLFGALKSQPRPSRCHIIFFFLKWQKRIFTTTVVIGLLMTCMLAVAQPSNLGDNQTIENDLLRASAELISANTFAENNLESTDAQYALAVAHERLGDLQMLRAEHDFPYQYGYGAAWTIADNNDKPNRNLMEKVERLESTSAEDSNDKLLAFRKRAKYHYGRARVLYQGLVALQPTNNKWQHALAMSYTKTYPYTSGDEKTRPYYQPALTILLRLTKLEPDNDKYQRDLAILYELIADKVSIMNDSLPAEYDEAHAIRMKLFRRDEKNPLFVFELAATLGNITSTALRKGKWYTARDAVTDQFGLIQDLAAMDPDNTKWQQALAAAHMKIAWVKMDNNNPGKEREKLESEGLVHYDEALKIRLHLIDVDPGNAQWQFMLLYNYYKMAEYYVNREQRNKALMLYIEAQQKMAQFAQRYPSDRGWLFHQIYLYAKIINVHRRIQSWSAPLSKGGRLPDPEKVKAARAAQKNAFKNVTEIVDTLVRMTGTPKKEST